MHTTNDRAGVTHIWPYKQQFNSAAQPFSDEREADIWEELRDLTFDEDVRGNVIVATHTPDLRVSKEIVTEQLLHDDVVINRVQFWEPREVACNVYRSGHNEAVKKSVPWSLSSKANADDVIAMSRKHEIAALVLWEPYDDGHLAYLDWVVRSCPDLPIYIFHNENRADKYGVEREAGAVNWQHRFHTKTEALTLPEVVDVVVRGLCNAGSISMWSALPKHGKSYLFLSIMKSLLSGEPWLNHFEVSKAKRVVYLVPEVGLRGVMKRLRKLRMVDHLYDPATNPDGCLFVQTLSSREKLKLDDGVLLEAVQGADVFVDPIIRYIEGDENSASDQRILSNKLLALISAEARSVWCAHHSPKAFKDVTDITSQNVMRGTGEFAAFPDILFGVLKTNDETSRLYVKCTDARDDDEYLGDFEVEMRPWIDETGDMKLVVAPGTGTPLKQQRKHGRKEDPDRQAKIDFAKNVNGSLQDKTAAVNEKFGSKHVKSTISEWLKEFDQEAA